MRRVNSHIERPAPHGSPRRGGRVIAAARLAGDLALSFTALTIATAKGSPGVAMHARAALLLARAAARGPAAEFPRTVAAIASPLDSVRYFEFDFAWRQARLIREGGRYLDASSPRLFPLCLIAARRDIRADLANPDATDLELTRSLASSSGLLPRSTLHGQTIDDLSLPDLQFDLVTSISVLEHIPAPGDGRAFARLWSLVRPGGQLVVSVPVSREAFDEYLDFDEYGLLAKSSDGWVFGQRVYDSPCLHDTFFKVVGKPAAMEVFGERRPGTFVADRAEKTSGRARPWREALETSRRYGLFDSIESLPGWGVAGMVFRKPPG